MQPYQINAEHDQAQIGHWPREKRKPPGWLLDMLAEQKMNPKGWGSVCRVCNIKKSRNGTCSCNDE